MPGKSKSSKKGSVQGKGKASTKIANKQKNKEKRTKFKQGQQKKPVLSLQARKRKNKDQKDKQAKKVAKKKEANSLAEERQEQREREQEEQREEEERLRQLAIGEAEVFFSENLAATHTPFGGGEDGDAVVPSFLSSDLTADAPTGGYRKMQAQREAKKKQEEYRLRKHEATRRKAASWDDKRKKSKLPVMGQDGKMVTQESASSSSSSFSSGATSSLSAMANVPRTHPDGKGKGKSNAAEEDEMDYSQSDVSDDAASGVEESFSDDSSTSEESESSESDEEEDGGAMQARRDAAQLEIASVSQQVMAEPEKHIRLLQKIQDYVLQQKDEYLRNLALLAQLNVLTDIIPGYKIIVHKKQQDETGGRTQQNEMISKDVMARRKYENSLLRFYTNFIGNVRALSEHHLNRNKSRGNFLDHTQATMTQKVLAKCVSTLMQKAWGFNQRKEVVKMALFMVNHKLEEIRQTVLPGITAVFRQDVRGDCALEIVMGVCHVINKKRGKVCPELYEVLLHMNLQKTIVDYDDTDEKLRQARSKSQKKKALKKDIKKFGIDETFHKNVERDIQAADAVTSIVHRKRTQTQMLHESFRVYFNVLKEYKQPAAMVFVLKGLARYAKLINLELVLDLLSCLKVFLDPHFEPKLTIESVMHVVTASLTVLQGHGEAIVIDMKEYYQFFYARLLELCAPEQFEHIPMLLQCCDLMFVKLRQFSTQRIASFVKRLAILAVVVPTESCIALTAVIVSLFKRHPKVRQLLDTECASSGDYNPYVEDPDYTNAISTTLWETALLRRSFDAQGVRTAARELMSVGGDMQSASSVNSSSSNGSMAIKKTMNPMELHEFHRVDGSKLSSYFTKASIERYNKYNSSEKQKKASLLQRKIELSQMGGDFGDTRRLFMRK